MDRCCRLSSIYRQVHAQTKQSLGTTALSPHTQQGRTSIDWIATWGSSIVAWSASSRVSDSELHDNCQNEANVHVQQHGTARGTPAEMDRNSRTLSCTERFCLKAHFHVVVCLRCTVHENDRVILQCRFAENL